MDKGTAGVRDGKGEWRGVWKVETEVGKRKMDDEERNNLQSC